jgi:hypothetical protein
MFFKFATMWKTKIKSLLIRVGVCDDISYPISWKHVTIRGERYWVRVHHVRPGKNYKEVKLLNYENR